MKWSIKVVPSEAGKSLKFPNVAIWAVERAVRPLVFATDLPEFPFAARGTVFLVEHEGHVFVVTNRHSIDAERYGVPKLCLFTDDGARTILPLKQGHFVSRRDTDAEWADLIAIGLDWSLNSTMALASEPLIQPPEVWRRAPHFFLVGFPEHRSDVDADRRLITLERIALQADYIGPSTMKYVHQLRIRSATEHPSFSGWSGSPVLALIPRDRAPPTLVLCGVAVSGTPSSGMVHFIDSLVLLVLIRRAIYPDARRTNLDGQLPWKT
jgi:hypothetical protein